MLAACCLLAIIFIPGCAALSREPGLSRQPTNTAPPATNTPTPVPVIEVSNITVRQGEHQGYLEVFGVILNITDDGLTELELAVSVFDPEGNLQAQTTVLPALRQISPGATTAFKAEFDRIDFVLEPEMVLVELASFQLSTITSLQITVDRGSARPNFEGGTTYLGYFSNAQPEYGELRNVEAFMIDEDDKPIDSADFILTTTSVEPRSEVPFRVDFFEEYGDAWPVFYVDAIPSENPNRTSPLWTVSEPRLFFTSQGIPYYLVEIKNTAFAPQDFEGILTMTEGIELQGILPVHSPIPIKAQSSWYFTLEPGLALPVRLRKDAAGMNELIATVTLDPLKTQGVSADLVNLELEIDGIETIGGSLYLQGTLSNPTDMDLADPVVFATLRTASAEVISANSELAAETIPTGDSLEFTLSLRIPAGLDPTALEFDLTALGVRRTETAREISENDFPVWYNFRDPGTPGF